ncbi:hypothetical protein HYH03_009224 [Edaphochlamys debaryana]|uniref:Calcineurin-like phosphoesterase domain-containing protein n=1 Tax=Edaphochlamys debaryana TaxID=47281 RepID=A0A835XZN9_9CHLO|nr:hypothetical protein HYH03_009224 [Edaphochlamys debaryana]|eukprot:KAG2492562.1 hypothetical protein HYH03_009224 [Edaphochlamys debaryana]
MAEPLPPDDEPAPADPPPPPLSVAVVSDLHLEARALEVDAVLDPELTADVLCLLGDIGDPSTPAYAAFIAACAARFPTVLLLAGNNEYRNREPQRHPHKHHHRHSNSNSHPHRRSQDQAIPQSAEEGRTAAAASGPAIERAGSTNAGRHSAAEPPAPSAGENVGGSSGAVSSASGAGGAGGRTMSDTEALIRSVASRHPNVHFLQNGVFESRGVAFIGSTLWSYLPEDPLPPPPGAEQAQQEPAQGPAPEPMPGAASSGPTPAGPAPETAAIGPSVGPTSAPAAPAASASRATAAQAAAPPLRAPESAGRVPPPRVAEAALANHALVVPLRAESLPTWSGSGLPLTAPSRGLGVELEAARAESLPLAAAFACLCANHEHPELHAGSGPGAAGSGSGFGSSMPPGCRALRCRGRFMKRVVSLARLPPDAPCPPVFGGGGRHGSREGSKEGAAVEGSGLLVMGSSVGASSTGTGSGSRSSSGSESGSDSGSSSGSEDEPGSGSGSESESEAEEKVEAGKQGQAALAAAQGPGLEDPTAAAPAGAPVDSSPASSAPTPSPPSAPAAPTSGPATGSKPSAEPPHTHHRRRPSASQAADPSTETTTITTVRSFIGATSLDYRLIPSAPGGAPITPDTTNALFAAAVEFIAGAVAGARARGLVPVVLTHHAPSLAGTSHPRFAGHPSTHAYGTDLVPYLHGTGIAAWYCGHTHYNFDVRLPCGLRLASNQFGSQPAPVAGYSRSWRQEIAVPAGAASRCSDGASKEAPPFPLPLAPPPAHASPAEADAAAVVRVVPVTAKAATGPEHERALEHGRPLGEACCGGSCGAGVGAPASPRPLRGAALGPSRLGRAPSTAAAAAGGRSA